MKFVKRGKTPEIKNLEKAAERIKKAVKNKEKIVLYGDADLDGAGSVIILKETIETLGGKVNNIYFPNREKEGYGLNREALQLLAKLAPTLLVVVDCGIGNFTEIKKAKKLGFQVIVIDHHEILKKLPQADIIVDPKQKGEKYPFKELATVGIVLKLAQILLGKKITAGLKKNFLELAALATLADMMPKEADNKEFISQGLKNIEQSWRPGIKAFFEMEPFKSLDGVFQQASKIISILNVRDVENRLPANFRVLTSHSVKEAKVLIKKLLQRSLERKEQITAMLSEVEARIVKGGQESIIFYGDPNWDVILLSPVASIICRRYKKPTFIYKVEKQESQGAVRMPQGLNGVKAMMSCSKLLKTYGGHRAAAGFRLKNENIDKFKMCLLKYFKKP